ncbi:MAG: ATP-binding protein [Bacilli bacterium]|nr:ATP-binding protein [Bacilli bacterium]
MEKNNPFSLMFGKPPYSFIERQAQFEEIMSTFLAPNPSTFSYVITGVRGSGKTVTLRKLAEEFRGKKDWIVLDVNPQGDLVRPLSEKLLYEGKKDSLFLDWSININAKIFTLEIKKGEGITNPEIIFENLLRRTNEAKKRVLITIDEVSPTPEMKYFANFYQSMVGKGYELFLLMTGLKNNVNSLVSSSASSFLSRMPKIDLPPLDLVEIAREYQRLMGLPIETAAALAKLTEGYAFAYQVLGYLFYNHDRHEIDNRLMSDYDDYLRRNGYGVIWKDLTAQEKRFCLEAGNGDNPDLRAISGAMQLSESNFQRLRSQLIEKGIIKSTGYGKIAFALPRFKQFVELQAYFE